MMCYRDRTFCGARECRHFRACSTALTEEVEQAARKIGLPISQFVDPTKLCCYKPERLPDESHP